MLHAFSQSILNAEPAPLKARAEGRATTSTPSNQQIINASKKAYSQYQSAVDAMAIAMANLINTGSQTAAISRLDDTNWASPGLKPDIAAPIFDCQDVVAVNGAARAFPSLNSLSVGVFATLIPGGGLGMVGFDRNLSGSISSARELTLTLDLFNNIVSTDPGKNLQLGLWLGDAGSLHDNVIGLYISTAVNSVPINLKILLTSALDPYGFVASTGATVNLPVNSGLFAGSTATWP